MPTKYFIQIVPEKQAHYRARIGTDTFPVKSPTATTLPHNGTQKLVYIIDKRRLPERARELLVAKLGILNSATLFIPAEDAQALVVEQQLELPAGNVITPGNEWWKFDR